jgi:amino-acid N-acetyltransferase
MKIRKANINDVKRIHSLVNKFAKKEMMLPRSLHEIYENIRDYFVCLDDGKIIASSALHIHWEDIAEIKSVAVSGRHHGQGVGKRLIKECLKEARSLGLKKVFALTYSPGFFTELGFKEIDKNRLPQKIWGECLKCHKFPDCDESAVIIKL